MKHIIPILLGLILLQINQLHSKELNLEEFDSKGQIILKTAIQITYPNNTTVWTAPGAVKLQWLTKNIPANKTIKFYLSKDDMVVQELGIFKNNSFANEVKLDRGLQTGDNYRVIGIELFPDNKYSIAKYATSLFTIKKAPRKQEAIVQNMTVEKKEVSAPKNRTAFEGRNINYVKELVVNSNTIRIGLWDHGRKDGDIVSIYLNGEAIVSKYHLEYKKKYFDLKLDASKANDLFLYAHNLGKFPPNTVSIEITDGEVAENIVLNSDLKSCEAVLINVIE